MKLKKIKLENFRGYKNFQVNIDENFNVIIGKNDVGKSTILDALEIFFNNETVKIDIEDLNVNAAEKVIKIGLVFEIDVEKEYLLDSTVKTSLKSEYLLNEENMLEIYKEWDCSKNKLSANSLKIYLIANYPLQFCDNPLIEATISSLKGMLKELEHSIHNYESINKSISSEIRKAIYSSTEITELQRKKISLNKDEGKKLYTSFSKELPLFCLFQSDRENKDTDKEVQDPLKAITKTAIAEVQSILDDVKEKIEIKANELGNETISKLHEMAPEIANVLRPNMKNKAWDSLFSFTFLGDDNIPINKRGSGVRRLILLNYFRAEAERKNISSSNVIYAIEEPETSQHPDHQIMLFDSLFELSQKNNTQVLLTTHTPEFAKRCSDNQIILLQKDEAGNTQIVEDEQKLSSVADALGLLPYYSKLVICVEGENDIKFLKGINKGIIELSNIFSLENKNISIIPMTGSNLINWVNRDYLKDSNVIEFHLYDRDKDNKYEKSVTSVNNRDDLSEAKLTTHNEMENYIHPSLIEKQFDIDCSSIRDTWLEKDIPNYVANKCKQFKESDIKSIINGNLSKKMTKELALNLGVYEEFEVWFKKIKELYNR